MSAFTIERARPEEAAALLEFLKIVGGETDNLSFGADGVPFGSSVLFSRMSVAIENPFERNGCHDWGKEAFLEKGCSSPSPNLPVWLAPTPSSLKAFHWWGGGAAVRFKNGSEQ